MTDPSEADCIRVVFQPSGMGDRSYNDQIYQGLRQVYEQSGYFSLEVCNPESEDTAKAAVQDWFTPEDAARHRRRLLILAASNLAPYLPENLDGDVLVLDHKEPIDGAYTRYVSAREVSKKAGEAVWDAGIRKVEVVLANPQLKVLEDFSEGFVEGFTGKGGAFNQETDLRYLGAGAYEGFDCGEALYRMCKDFPNGSFVLPACGGSIEGVLRYTREKPGVLKTCGVDSSMGLYSSDVMFSIVKRMDLLVGEFAEAWLDGETLARHESYEDGYIYLEK